MFLQNCLILGVFSLLNIDADVGIAKLLSQFSNRFVHLGSEPLQTPLENADIIILIQDSFMYPIVHKFLGIFETTGLFQRWRHQLNVWSMKSIQRNEWDKISNNSKIQDDDFEKDNEVEEVLHPLDWGQLETFLYFFWVFME